MAARRIDVAIIGAGAAGLAACGRVREHTERLLLIEGGGTAPPAPASAACRASP